MKLLLLLLLITTSLFSANLTDYQTNYLKSFTLEENKKYDDAVKLLEEIYPKYKYDYELNLRLGWLKYLDGKYDSSIEYLGNANKINKNAIEPLNMLLLPYTALKDIKNVKKYASLVIKKSPANYYAHIRLAYAYYYLNKFEEALHHYKILNSFYPSDIDGKLGLAATYLKLKDFINAQKYYLEILKVSPYHETAYNGYLATLKK
jgi:tetratricopeptide (TPR) repeat protein